MLRHGILNPALNSLLSRVRHTNALVIADRGFPFWPQLETIDLSLVDNVPTVLQVLTAIRQNFITTHAFMAEEFLNENTPETQTRFAEALHGLDVTFETHLQLKQRVPHAIGLVRTGDITQYSNLVLISGR